MKLKYFKEYVTVPYPTGRDLKKTYNYAVQCASLIENTFTEKDILLVCRGHSGSIIAGCIATLLQRKNRKIKIIISRKKREKSHSYTLETWPDKTEQNYHIIIVDDFIESGETIASILEDIIINTDYKDKIDALCVENSLNYKSIKDYEDFNILLDHFKYVFCNKP